MAKSENEKLKRAQRTREFLGQLAERYPNCFTRDPNAVRPLAIGIQQHLRDELAKDEAFKDTPNWLIRQALALYTRSGAYLNAIIEKRPRINLDGSDAGEIGDKELAHAQQQMDELKKRRAERAEQQRPQRPPRKPRREQAGSAERKERKPRKPEAEQRKPREPQLSPEERTRRKLEALAQKFSKN